MKKKEILCSDCNHSCHCIAITKTSIKCGHNKCKCSECRCFEKNLIKDKKLSIKAIKEHRYQIDKVDKKFLGDKDIIIAGLNSKNPYEWAIDPVIKFIRDSKIKDKKFLKYILSKNALVLGSLDTRFRKDRDLAFVAVNQNGHAINFLDEKLQLDRDLIKLALKVGRTDMKKGKKYNFHLPELSYWQVVLDNTNKKGIGEVNGLKIWCSWDNRERYYWGETLNGIPNGQGYSETYETHEIIRKTFKVVPKKSKDKYFKNLSKKKEGYIITEKYEGEWKNGMMHGYGEFIEYHEPEYFINRDGTAKPMNKYKGNFVKGKKEGMFEVYQDMGGDDEKTSDWTKQKFKNDY
jgi:hypothetical protein